MNPKTIKSRNISMFECFCYCTQCHKKSIVLSAKIKRLKLAICSHCKNKTQLILIGCVHKFGKNKQYQKLKYFDTPFKAFYNYVLKSD
jgi:hypothetical protein